MTYHKFERGLGKEDIQIAPIRCSKCGKSGVTLHKKVVNGKKVYICKECKDGEDK